MAVHQIKLKPILQNGELLLESVSSDFFTKPDPDVGESEGEMGKKPIAVISLCNVNVTARENLTGLLASIVSKLSELEGTEEPECSMEMECVFPENCVLAIDKWFQIASMDVIVLVVPTTTEGAEGLIPNGLTIGDKNMLFAMLIASSVCMVMSESDFRTHANQQLTNFVNLEIPVKVIRGMNELPQELEMADISAPAVSFFVCDVASNIPYLKPGGDKVLEDLLTIDKMKLRAFVEPPAHVLRLIEESGGEPLNYLQQFTTDFIKEVEAKEFQHGTSISREEFPAAAQSVFRLIAGLAPRASSTGRMVEPYHHQPDTIALPRSSTHNELTLAMDTLTQEKGPSLGKLIFKAVVPKVIDVLKTVFEKQLPVSSKHSTDSSSSQRQGSEGGEPMRPHSPVPSTSQGSGTSFPGKEEIVQSCLPVLLSAFLGTSESGTELEVSDSDLFPTIWGQIVLLDGRMGDKQFDIVKCLREAPTGQAWLNFQAYLTQHPGTLVHVTLDYRSDTPFLANLGIEPGSRSERSKRAIPYNRNTCKVRRRTFSMDARGFLGVLGYLFPMSPEEEDRE